MKILSAVLAVASCMMLCALEVSVGEVGTLVHDGNHNAFPSICRFGNDLYLSFRKAVGHRPGNGVLPVYRSQDMGKTWEKIAEIADSNGDLRDPRCVVVGGKLMIYSGLVAYNQANQKSWCVKAYQMNDDGKFIEIPVSGFLKNSFIWGVVAYDGGYVATAYVPGNTASLYKSRDGLNWEHWLTFPERGNEVSLAVDATGDLHCILRTIDVRNFWPWYYNVGKDGKFVTAKRIKEGMQGIMLQCVGDGFVVQPCLKQAGDVCKLSGVPFQNINDGGICKGKQLNEYTARRLATAVHVHQYPQGAYSGNLLALRVISSNVLSNLSTDQLN